MSSGGVGKERLLVGADAAQTGAEVEVGTAAKLRFLADGVAVEVAALVEAFN